MKKIFFAVSLLFCYNANSQYNSLLWKISGNGLQQPSYLYGTMHTSDSRVFSLSDNAMPFLTSSKAYAMELDPKEAMNMSLISKLVMGGNYSLKKMIPEVAYSFLDSVIKNKMGIGIKMFDNVAPIFTMTLFEAATMELAEDKSPGKGEVLDMYFYKQAKKKKKKLVGIETVSEQIDALNVLNYNEQADLLVKEIELIQRDTAEGTDVLNFYLDQNLDSLAANSTDVQIPPKFYKALVIDRNIRMAERIALFVNEQPTFIAVGALHLPGEVGVIDLLRKRGFTVEPIKK